MNSNIKKQIKAKRFERNYNVFFLVLYILLTLGAIAGGIACIVEGIWQGIIAASFLAVVFFLCAKSAFRRTSKAHDEYKALLEFSYYTFSSERDVKTKSIENNYDCHARMAYYYHAALELTRKSQLSQNADYELLPAMLSLLDLCAFETNRDRTKTLNDFQSMIRGNCRQFTKHELESFNPRLDLYSEIIRGKHTRGEWHFGTFAEQEEDNFIARVCAALGDILINPDCADDYDNAPLMLHDIHFVFLFAQETMVPLIKLFSRMYSEFHDQRQIDA